MADVHLLIGEEFAPYEETGVNSISIPTPDGGYTILYTESGSAGVKSIADGSITTITAEMLSGITSFRSYAFAYLENLVSCSLPSSAASVSNNMFHSCRALESVVLPNGLTSIGDNAFRVCESLESIQFPTSLSSIGVGAFQYSGLKTAIIPEGITTIARLSFSECNSLKSIELPTTVTAIDVNAFFRSFNIESITVKAAMPPTLDKNSLQTVPNDCAIYVPAGSVSAYKAAQYWSERAAYIQAIPSV
jgi:hypothetical protein